MMKKRIAVVLSLILVVSCLGIPVSATIRQFDDVKTDDYFYYPVQWAAANGVTEGIGANLFGPSKPCTRAQVVMFLWRAADSPAPSNVSNPFIDVSAEDYFYTAVLWAVENGITSGVNEKEFGPNQTCTRAQIVTFLWQFKDAPVPANPTPGFSDVDAGAYYAAPVAWALENEVTAGIGGSRFAPEQTCTRGQVVTFLFKTMGMVAPEDPDPTVPPEPTVPVEPGVLENIQTCTDMVAGVFHYEEAKKVLDLVNNARAENGLSPLTWSTDMDDAAKIRAAETTISFSHTRPDGTDCFTAHPMMIGENIAYGYPDAQSVFEGWMNSQGHRENILRGSFTTMCLAAIEKDGIIYWAQLFG